MEPSDDDPVYVMRFKKVFTIDLSKSKESTNLTWLKMATVLDPRFKDLKCLPKDERDELWTSISSLVKEERLAQQPSKETTGKQPPKKTRMSEFLFCSSDSSDSDDSVSIDKCLECNKSEPKINMDQCPLQWWPSREGAHVLMARIACRYLSTPATIVPCERLFSLSGHIVQKKRDCLLIM